MTAKTHMTKNEAPITVSNDQVEIRTLEAGDYTVSFFTVKEDFTPPAVFFKGLPDNMCQSPHYGYVFKGKGTFKYKDHEETLNAGEAYYMKPGHIPIHIEKGTEFLEVSPKEENERTMKVVLENMKALQT